MGEAIKSKVTVVTRPRDIQTFDAMSDVAFEELSDLMDDYGAFIALDVSGQHHKSDNVSQNTFDKDANYIFSMEAECIDECNLVIDSVFHGFVHPKDETDATRTQLFRYKHRFPLDVVYQRLSDE